MFFSIVGLAGYSTPGLAAEVTAAAPAVVPALVPVIPAQNPAFFVQALPQEETPVETQDQDEVVFPTLAAAVEAHDDEPSQAATEAQRCLAGAIYYESKGEPLAGQLAVANVIINRSKSGKYPDDVCDVVTQRGQFGFVRGGRIPAIDETRATYKRALAVARVALAEAWNSPAPRAMFFNTPDRMPGVGLKKIAAIGNHIFYR